MAGDLSLVIHGGFNVEAFSLVKAGNKTQSTYPGFITGPKERSIFSFRTYHG